MFLGNIDEVLKHFLLPCVSLSTLAKTLTKHSYNTFTFNILQPK